MELVTKPVFHETTARKGFEYLDTCSCCDEIALSPLTNWRMLCSCYSLSLQQNLRADLTWGLSPLEQPLGNPSVCSCATVKPRLTPTQGPQKPEMNSSHTLESYLPGPLCLVKQSGIINSSQHLNEPYQEGKDLSLHGQIRRLRNL